MNIYQTSYIYHTHYLYIYCTTVVYNIHIYCTTEASIYMYVYLDNKNTTEYLPITLVYTIIMHMYYTI